MTAIELPTDEELDEAILKFLGDKGGFWSAEMISHQMYPRLGIRPSSWWASGRLRSLEGRGLVVKNPKGARADGRWVPHYRMAS